jgi:GNAT superfamily N-acetyltransferase
MNTTSSGIHIAEVPADRHQEVTQTIAEAFREEAITSYALDKSDEEIRRRYRVFKEIMLQVFIDAGHLVLMAQEDERVTGAAIARVPHRPISRRTALSLLLPRLPSLLRVIFGLRRGFFRLPWAVRPPKDLPKPHYVLEILAVHPDHQGRGIARLLLERVHALADADDSAAGIYLTTGEEYTRQLYERFGYRVLITRQAGTLPVHHMFRPRQVAAVDTD